MAFSHPASVCFEKYPYPVEVNVRDFVPINLSNENYVVWKTLMLRLIEGHGLAGFINGEVSAPPERITVENDGNDEISKGGTKKIESLDYHNWERSERLLQRWIIGTINEDLLPHVVCLKSAKDMWSKLDILRGRKFVYPYPAGINVKEFVKLTKHNYSKWEKPMLDLIKSQGLDGFINGEVPIPDQWIPVPDDGPTNYATTRIENEGYRAWKKTDALLQHWIRETVINLDDLYLMGSPTFSMTSKEMWHLIKRYHTKDSYDEEIDSSSEYLELHKAVLTCDWRTTEKFIEEKSDAVRAFITRRNETALMIAVTSAKGNRFVKRVLLEKMSEIDLALPDALGRTALHYAAMAGNTEAAKFLVGKNPNLPHNCDHEDLSPLYLAAKYGKRKTVDYLLEVTKYEDAPSVFEDINGSLLIKKLILSGLYDTALRLIKDYPDVAWVQSYPALKVIASRSSSAFKSGAHLNWGQNLLYPYVPTKLKDYACHHCRGGDIESLIDNCYCFLSAVKQNLHWVIWSHTLLFVPQINYIRKIKLKHEQALQLVKHLCRTSLEINYPKAKEVLQRSLVIAARFGIPELVEEIIAVSPDLIYHKNEMGQNIFHIAILNRCENLFNLIYQCREEVRHIMLSSKDKTHKKCIDLVVDLKKEQRLNLRTSAAGAALQMQRELQWFQEVQKRSNDSNDYWEDNLTPEKTTFGTLYTESHEELVKEGEKWIKETAKSCTIVAALIATIVFAAVITVPGGNDCKNGLPILFEQNAFIIFVISDAFALSSSISSVLMFLAILTSRYSVTDFLYTLPNKLIIGLLFLFFSILSMMIAFGATLYLIFGHKITWLLIPFIGFSGVPVTFFVFSQFPLLVDMIRSTYFPGIFGQRSDRILS